MSLSQVREVQPAVSPTLEMTLAISHLDAGHSERALPHARRAVALVPNQTEPVFVLALTTHQAGADPEPIYRHALALAADHIPASINLAGWLAGCGRLAAAISGLRRVITLAPAVPQALGNLALAVRGAESPASVVCRLQRVLALLKDDAPTLLNLGDALSTAGATNLAVAALRQAVRVAPGFAQAQHGLALMLQNVPYDKDPPSEILGCLRRACTIEPGFAGAWASAAAVVAGGDQERARQWLRRAMSLNSFESAALGTLANLSRQQGRLGVAHRLRRRLVALDPDVAQGLNNLALSALDQGEIEAAACYLRRALSAAPDRVDIHNNLLFCLTYDPALTEAALFAEYRRWERQHATPMYRPVRPHDNAPDPTRRLRVGYLSADFRNHAIAWLVEDLLAAHDRAQVEPICYAEVARPDATTERFRKLVPLWRSTVGRSDSDVAEMVRADQVDILVILAGHTASNRIRVAALKPAPIQINLHNLSTSGLATVDYWLTDPALHPEGGIVEGMTERLLRIPSLYLHHLPSAEIEPGSPPALVNGYVTFGSFSNPAKINHRVIELWASVLQAMPTAQLLLGYQGTFADPSIREIFHRRFAAFGVATRVSYLDAEPDRAKHLARIARLDIALDPFPFNGGTTTFEALWMGVPVITLAGRRFAARCGVTHLTQVGLEDLIADTGAGYRRISVALANDIDRLREIRRSLRQRVVESRLAGPTRYAETVESAYRSVWQDWCAKQGGVRRT